MHRRPGWALVDMSVNEMSKPRQRTSRRRLAAEDARIFPASTAT